MTVKECYVAMEGDYEGVMQRLMTEARIVKYLNKFLDNQDYTGLCETLAAQNYEDAFRHSHNLKGVGLNLGMTKLHQSSDVLCETLRGGTPKEDVGPLLEQVKKDYEQVVEAIRQLQ